MFSLNEASTVAREPDVAAAVDAVDRYLEARAGPSRFRMSDGAAFASEERERFRGLVELGVASAFLPESAGGSAMPEGAAPLFAERFGWWLAREPFVENVVLPSALAHRIGDKETAAAVAGGQVVCVAWQEEKFDRAGRRKVATSLTQEGNGWRLTGTKRFVMGASASDRLLVLASSGTEPVLVLVPSGAAGVTRQDKLLADGSYWSEIRFDVHLGEGAVRSQGPTVPEALAGAIAVSNLALSGALYGLLSRVLAMTLDYLRTRVQFDRPIGAFQALQHRATDLYTHAQIARFLLGEATDAVREGVSERVLETYASRTKARSSDAALRIAKEGIQMHGAIGFSDEHDLGLHVKRILVLTAWLGSADWHRRHVATLDPLALETLT